VFFRHSAPNSMATFFVIVVTQTLSLIGSRMTSIAVGIWVFNDTGRTAPLLLTAFFLELPGMLGGSVPRRKLAGSRSNRAVSR